MLIFEIVNLFIHIFINNLIVNLIVTCTTLHAQITLNPGVDTFIAVHKVIINFRKDYLVTKPSQHTQTRLDSGMRLLEIFCLNPLSPCVASILRFPLLPWGYATVLSMLPVHDSLYEFRTAVGSCIRSGTVQLMAVTWHFVSPESGQPKMVRPCMNGHMADLKSVVWTNDPMKA